MSWSASIKETPEEFVRMAYTSDGYQIIHTTNGVDTILHSGLDRKIAAAWANNYAKDKHLLCIIPPGPTKQKIFTVIEKDNQWFPAEFVPEGITEVSEQTREGKAPPNLTQTRATKKALRMARNCGGIFLEIPHLPSKEK